MLLGSATPSFTADKTLFAGGLVYIYAVLFGSGD